MYLRKNCGSSLLAVPRRNWQGKLGGIES